MLKRNVTFLINSLRGGGAERVCVTLANAFADRGWNVELVVLNLKDAVLRDELHTSVKLINLGVGHARYSFLRLWHYLRLGQPGRILVFNHQLAVALIMLRAILSFKTTIIVRNISTLSLQRENQKSVWHKHIIGSIVKAFYRKTDRFIAQSQGMRADLVKNYGVLSERISVINNPLNQTIESYLADPVYEFVNFSDRNYILYVGRLEPVKAVHLAIEAFAGAWRRFPWLRFKIVGQGSMEQKLRLIAKKHGVSDQIDFEGFRKEIIPYYLGARATILTSIYEGFPNVLVESIALGTPVIAFNCPSGPSEIVQDGVNGYLIEERSTALLAEKIVEVIEIGFPPAQVVETSSRFRSDYIVQRYIGELTK